MTSKYFNDIITELNKVSKAYFRYTEDKKNVLNDYRSTRLSDELLGNEASTRRFIADSIFIMRSTVKNMIKEVEAGNVYDAKDPAVANAALLLSSSGVNPSAVEALLKPFLGNQVALSLIRASAKEEYHAFIDAYIFDNVGSLNSMLATIGKLEYESPDNFPSIVSEIREALVSFATHMGIELGSMGEALEDLRMVNIASMMGFDWDQIQNA